VIVSLRFAGQEGRGFEPGPPAWQAEVELAGAQASALMAIQLGLFPDTAKIANGHGWTKHQSEFPGWDQQGYQDAIEKTVQFPDKVKQLKDGRTAYWNDKEKMVVIHDPKSPDDGTAFRPDQVKFPGDSYLNTLK
jgi:hypothetical protein